MAEGEKTQRASADRARDDTPLTREEKLAKALRENLRRRKAKKD